MFTWNKAFDQLTKLFGSLSQAEVIFHPLVKGVRGKMPRPLKAAANGNALQAVFSFFLFLLLQVLNMKTPAAMGCGGRGRG